jgi:hypothetical protein
MYGRIEEKRSEIDEKTLQESKRYIPYNRLWPLCAKIYRTVRGFIL